MVHLVVDRIKLTLPHLWVKPLNHPNIQLILGLNFLGTPDRALLLTKDYAIFLSTLIVASILSEYSSEFRTPERGDVPTSMIDLPKKMLIVPMESQDNVRWQITNALSMTREMSNT